MSVGAEGYREMRSRELASDQYLRSEAAAIIAKFCDEVVAVSGDVNYGLGPWKGDIFHQIEGGIERALKEQGVQPVQPVPAPLHKKIPIPGNLRKEVFERDAYRCRYCSSWSNLHAHHVVPESRGGEATLTNLVTACGHCNMSIGTKFQPPAGWGEA